ncbi:helix-loop-helix DNA binding protein [Metarhizium acridum CQMa 102]|uniref:Helix-loop-helix DNA binding protein n=1 Tax=Metarhizium acridum (strain CQMa 102) TaxID=655827 RepID=E9DXZ7_METAQ|nr:helix-loop-helix DNA binding protein [Metarhizium acridum CQMa 102]EFY91332.1 helix-loop-helix DNA binding protein [Metarhizium acridum CQMa 102]
MSDPVATEQPDLSSLTSSPGSKRKREPDSPGSQRAKRAAPPAAMTAETAAFIENAIEATHAAAANGVNVADFNALQQAAAADHTDASDPSNATSTAQAALGMYPTLHVPPSTEEQFAAQAAAEGEHNPDAAFDAEIAQQDMMDPSAVTQQPPENGVERRRRETINEGINELAKIVPGCEKNKGSILQRAVSFISQLKENEQQNIEKWTLEKLLTEQAITELSASNDKLKQECERLYRELETWKRVAQNAGLEPPQPKEEPNMGASSS